MCRRVECNQCHKPSFAGCGMHVEQVLGDVPKDQRCACRYTASASSDSSSSGDTIVSRIFGGLFNGKG
jgi:hypothetical protein